MLLEYAAAASRLLINRGLLQPALRREPELVNLQEGQLTRTVWEQMKTKISVTGVAEQLEVGKYLLCMGTPSGEPDVTREPDLKALYLLRTSCSPPGTIDVPFDIARGRPNSWLGLGCRWRMCF